MRKKLLGFMYGMFGIFVCIAILFPLLTAVTSSSQYLYAATVKALVVGGGGKGANGTLYSAGGGGGGKVTVDNLHTVIAQAYSITVGGSSQSSSFDTITAASGGEGFGATTGNGGTSGSGNAGGTGGGGLGSGGGGGDSAVGGSNSGGTGGNGGSGTSSTISGSLVTYGGGGGGGSVGGGTPGNGVDGGGNGGAASTNGNDGAVNRGGGGGGSGNSAGQAIGGSGGSGIVIIRYVTADFGTCTGGTITTDGADTIHTFTSSGTFTVVLPVTFPTVTTGSITNVTSSSATLNGTVNANGQSTTAWFNYGITSGSYTGTSTTQSVSGSSNTTISSDISGLSSNTTYYYRIAASSSAGTSYGSEASFTTSAPTDTTPPTVNSTSPANNATGVAVSGAISATFSEDMNSSTITTSTFMLSSSSGSVSGTVSYSNKVATFTPSSNLSYSTTYTATITTGVKDFGGNAMSSNYTWSFTTGSAPDTTAPSNASISINSGASYTNSTSVTLTLSATDSVGIIGYYASTSSSTPTASASGWNSVTSTTSYTGSVSYSLASGDESKTVYVWYKDATGNVSSAASDSIILDTTTPIVTITSPTSSDTYTTTSSPLSLSGSASDSTSGVKEVTWSNNKGGSGTASGTTYWSVSSISLSIGDNIINVTATDNAGNTGKDTITVTYTVPPSTPTTTPKPSPIQTPTATPTPTSILTGSIIINGGATYTNSTTVTLNLSASNITGVTGYYLSTSSTKPSSGDTGWVSISSTTSYSADVSYTLSSDNGNQAVYVWYKDTAGNISDAANDSIILDTTAPTVTITSPTSDSTYTTTSAIINIGGSASDSASGLNSVVWSNDKGGVGTADGIISWYISDINLAGGDNTISVTATDGAGNTGADTITVTYETSTITPIPTVSDICSAESIKASPSMLFLKRKQSGEITVSVTGDDDCPVEGEKVEVLVNAAGKKKVTASPSNQATDENGEATFRITAKNKAGIARVSFKAAGLKRSITVKVKR